MAGYDGYSMSNNARDAYDRGEKPLSKWTKGAILEALENDGDLSPASLAKLRKFSASFLFKNCLNKTGWHHSSSFFNKITFYEAATDLTDGEVDELARKFAAEKAQPKQEIVPAERRVEVSFLQWWGPRRHPRAERVFAKGKIVGDWFFPESGLYKKLITGRGFRVEKDL